jgi:hypothetical protein
MANKAGDPVRTMRLFIEGVFQLEPGGFDRLPEATQTMLLEPADVRSSAPAGHHERCTEDLHQADAGHAWRENAGILQADQ